MAGLYGGLIGIGGVQSPIGSSANISGSRGSKNNGIGFGLNATTTVPTVQGVVQKDFNATDDVVTAQTDGAVHTPLYTGAVLTWP